MNHPHTLTLSWTQWQAFLSSLREDEHGQLMPVTATTDNGTLVDAYVFSAHAEAMQSSEVDGELWNTLQDIEATASTEEEAWQKITTFYLERGCILIQIPDAPEREEWIINEELAERLGLTQWAKSAD